MSLAFWGSTASIAGIAISVIGFAWAIRQARRAASAGEAAEKASQATRAAIASVLGIQDTERAVARIHRVRDLLLAGEWRAAREVIQDLRVALGEVMNRYPELDIGTKRDLRRALGQIQQLESVLMDALRTQQDPEDPGALDGVLGRVQDMLESIVTTSPL